jgi:hypothetical protein
MRPNEFPAGSTLTAVLDVKNIEHRSLLRLSCEDDTSPRASLQIGQQTANLSLQQLSPDQLFLSYNTAALPAGCDLQAAIDNGRDGESQPFDLAKIVLLPQIDSITASTANVPAPNGATAYNITGQNLEMIQKAGWDQTNGIEPPSLPNPLPGQAQKQSLTVNLPAPPANQPFLYLWLRGDQAGRATTINVPVPLPVPTPPAAKPPCVL